MKNFVTTTLIQLLVIASISSAAQMQEEKLFDRFENINCEDEKARLDNFAVQLQSDPNTVGYIIFYGGRRYGPTGRTQLPRRNEAEVRAARLKSYLVDSRGLPVTRLVLVNGGYRETWQAELWIAPTGAKSPTPTPTLKPEQIKFRKGLAREKDYRCSV